jgi:hypothetical protein
MSEIEEIATELTKLDIPDGDAQQIAADLVALSQRSDPTRNLPIVEIVRRLVYDKIHDTAFSTPDMEIVESRAGWVTKARYLPLPVESEAPTDR